MPERSGDVASAVRILENAKSVVVSSGAGMSKESGIPTFRDAPSALWENFRPEQLATRGGFRSDPSLVWRWYDERRRMISEVAPNPGHVAIVDLEKRVDRVVVVTQNIDNLHREAGSTDVLEVHGNIFRYQCFDRGHPIETLPDDDHVPPRCHCGSLIRPAVVWFGENLPVDVLDRVYRELENCDAVIVVGTSGVVFPAAGFPEYARRFGARVVEVNPEPSEITPTVDVFLRGPAGEVLPDLVRALAPAEN